MSLALLALAAGRSTRFGRLKQLEPLGPDGETLLEYAARDGAAAGFERLVVVVSPESGNLVRDSLDAYLGRHLPVQWCVQRMEDIPAELDRLVGRTRPWGTAHAVYAARGMIEEPFGVVNADDWYGPEALELLASSLADGSGKDWSLVTYPVEVTLSSSGGVSRALCQVDSSGRLLGVEELADVHSDPEGRIVGTGARGVQEIPRGSPVSMNLWGLDGQFFDIAERVLGAFVRRAEEEDELALPDVVERARRVDHVDVTALPGGREWIGVTHSLDRQAAVERLAEMGPGPRSPRV